MQVHKLAEGIGIGDGMYEGRQLAVPDESMAYGVHPVLRSVSHELVGRIEVELPPPGVDDFGLHDVLGSDGVELPDNQRIGHRVCGLNLSAVQRSEERRLGNECVSPFRCRWSQYH